MFQKKGGHGFFCRCEMCKMKKRQNLFYLLLVFALIVICLYQAILTVFFTTKLNAMILLCELLFLFCGWYFILF